MPVQTTTCIIQATSQTDNSVNLRRKRYLKSLIQQNSVSTASGGRKRHLSAQVINSVAKTEVKSPKLILNSIAAITTISEITANALAIFPPAVAPIGSLLLGGNSLNKQRLQQNSSSTIDFTITGTKLAEAQISFSIATLKGEVILEKTLTGTGGVFIQETIANEDDTQTLVGTILLYPNQTVRKSKEEEFNYSFVLSQDIASKRYVLSTGTITLYRA